MRNLRSLLPPLNFITIHYGYFIVVPLAASLVFWGSSNPSLSISYVDSLFLIVSAMTEAGLNTVNLSQMTTWQQVILWLMIIIGSSIWVSIWTVLVRKHAFERRFEEIVKKERETSRLRRNTSLTLLPITKRLRTFSRSRNAARPASALVHSRDADGSILPISAPIDGHPISTIVPARTNQSSIELTSQPSHGSLANPEFAQKATFSDDEPLSPSSPEPEAGSPGATSNMEHIVFADDVRNKGVSSSFAPRNGAIRRHIPSTDNAEAVATTHDYPSAYKVGRNAQFHSLTIEERENLGGTEYRALRLLSIFVPIYFFAWQILGSVALGAWIANNQPQPALDNAISPWWNGIFNGVSAFNNSGMSVLDLNMIPYGGSYFVLIVMGAMILAGNTAYPLFLRLSLWLSPASTHVGRHLFSLGTYMTGTNATSSAVLEDYVEWKATLEYILKYPRRVYTSLFPSRQTWWLLFMLFTLNGTDWVAFEILNLGNPTLANTPIGSRVIDGLFQALAVRSGGFYVVSIPTLYIGLQVLT
ncbi:Uu.00g029870.m01.CDS01 [Anthostomella pinea]|uniref:Uu.00g029870.m01.CDS01 n=1 Tax=Anthostomella pinea TaxID=933095 RepID=A0AAI8V868_9PEZI|nr:Uu.00g029870.m01.CDS01 [Anthostomella pinea]